MVPTCVAEDLPEQQPGEGKCPLTHYVILSHPGFGGTKTQT
jgi:hypothetical protein